MNGMAHGALVRQLGEEEHLVTGSQVRGWLTQWAHAGVLRQLHDGSYIRAGRPTAPREPVNDDAVPSMLLRARDAAREAGGAISSRRLFEVMQRETPVYRDASDLAGQLVALLRKVSVVRPDRGQVRVHPAQPKTTGFTTTTLEQGISAYRATAASLYGVSDK
ncbi:hypothetical protein [Streptomyces sp. NPDC090026]|uniref:hypothetical protein n=1 Tax=Streptomyces sp. NPDC090026 TaxID=3365923 RepID=UPI00382F576E